MFSLCKKILDPPLTLIPYSPTYFCFSQKIFGVLQINMFYSRLLLSEAPFWGNFLMTLILSLNFPLRLNLLGSFKENLIMSSKNFTKTNPINLKYTLFSYSLSYRDILS